MFLDCYEYYEHTPMLRHPSLGDARKRAWERMRFFWIIAFYGVRPDKIAHNVTALCFYLGQIDEENWAYPVDNGFVR